MNFNFPRSILLCAAILSASYGAVAQTQDRNVAIEPLLSNVVFPVPDLLRPTTATTTAATKATPAIPGTAAIVLESGIDVFASIRQRDSTEGFERRIAPGEVESSAGTFGDPSRYLQTLAGVVSDNDQRNDFLVRGGNPSENAFVIDNIEIPSINQLAMSDTTGGFVSMLDAAAIRQITLHTDSYDSRYDQRLSSIVEISTRPTGLVERHSVEEVGLAGAGGSTTRPWGPNGSLFFSARQGVL